MRTVLIDADILAYDIGMKTEVRVDGFVEDGSCAVQTVCELDEAYRLVDAAIDSLRKNTESDNVRLALSDPDSNWRTDILPTYKCNRAKVSRPTYWGELRTFLQSEYRSYLKPNLEGDDVLGILHTHPKLIKGETVVATVDKDLRTVPGLYYNWGKEKPKLEFITEREAERYHMRQTLTGDPVDGYGGVPLIGEKLATDILDAAEAGGYPYWEGVVAAYEEWGMTEEDALCIARVARICQWQDYDYVNKEVILWNPNH